MTKNISGSVPASLLAPTCCLLDELILICSSSHRFAGLSAIDPAELEKEDFIIRETGSGTRKIFESAMSANDIAWRAAWICNNTSAIIVAVSTGLGVSVISRRSVENEVKNGTLMEKELQGITFKRKFKSVYHRNKFLTDKMKLFLDICINTQK